MSVCRRPDPDVELQYLRTPAQLGIKGNGGRIPKVCLNEDSIGITLGR
jgi:hypothetical protein